ncbi:MAG: SUMF1/EgtB/PvdO family nonheme iron enzyme [Anaerolineales bacterium]|jgi:formylglycine-generating enzyme required for sulfatase activity|nr:SUMF1/EgtB/PvdO family nonheme iron enzyme [Anaerolineales bacterium]
MPNLQEQIETLRKKIAAYRALQEQGEDFAERIEALEAELHPLVETQGGAFVAGNVQTGGGAFVGRDQVLATLADGSVIIGGNAQGVIVITGDNNRVTLGADQVPPEALLKMYYRSLSLECRRLPLGVVDPNFADPLSQDGVSLSDVYTDLHVVSPLGNAEEEKDLRAFGLHLARGKEGERTKLLESIAEPQARLLTLVGDPGSGKTTFTNYLTFLLADSIVFERQPELPESLKTLLPVRLVLRQGAKFLPTDGSKGSARMLWQAFFAEISERIGQAAAAQLIPYLQNRLGKDGGLFLLDGLDEVPDADRRRKCLLEAVNDLACGMSAKSRVLLTARPYAYADPKWRLPGFQLLALAPFDEEQANRFIERWYQAVRTVMGWDVATARERGERLAGGIQQKPYLADLASRPLLLTLMATLDSSWGKLPEDRADLYEESVKLLLSRWQRGREVRNEQGQADWEPSISKALGLGEEKIRAALEKLAYQIHLRQAGDEKRDGDSADIPRGEVLDVFCAMLPEDFNADLLVRYLETRSGLLMGRRENVYAFPHRSFQEYLAACHLAAVEQDMALKLRQLVYSDLTWWREVFLLGVGKKRLGGLGGAVGLVQTLVPGEVAYAKNISETDWQASVLAGQALLEMRLKERAPAEESFETITDRLRRWLVRIVEDGLLTPAQRLEAADTLATLGDPRFDEKRLHLPVLLRGQPEPLLGFVKIPAGTFTMGSAKDDKDADDDDDDDEKPAHPVTMPEFYMARYPVTNAQYRHFIDADGYTTEKYWTPEGWAWRNGADYDLSSIKDDDVRKNYQNWLAKRPAEKRHQPYWWNDPQWGAPTRPVVGLCWYESMAYCNWLDERLCAIEPKLFAKGHALRLPTEAEWEYAARGLAGRKWAWGNDWQDDHANIDETGLKQTNPVGLFPQGRTPVTDLFDLTGNTWEWQHSRWGNDLYNPEYGYPYKIGDGRENSSGASLRILRGGSWNNDSWNARCAYRLRLFPDGFDLNLGFRCVVSLAISDS